MFPQYGELGPLETEIVSLVWGTPANFNGFRILAALLHGTPVLGVSQTLRRWTEGATYIRQGGHHVGHWPTFLITEASAFVAIYLFTYTLRLYMCYCPHHDDENDYSHPPVGVSASCPVTHPKSIRCPSPPYVFQWSSFYNLPIVCAARSAFTKRTGSPLPIAIRRRGSQRKHWHYCVLARRVTMWHVICHLSFYLFTSWISFKKNCK